MSEHGPRTYTTIDIDELAALRERVGVLEEALAPLLKLANKALQIKRHPLAILYEFNGATITQGDLIKARTALSTGPEEERRGSDGE